MNHTPSYEEKIGTVFGFVASFMISSLILFTVLSFFGKLPDSWGYANILMIISSVTLLAYGVKIWLR